MNEEVKNPSVDETPEEAAVMDKEVVEDKEVKDNDEKGESNVGETFADVKPRQ